ncbi:hypothetical protein CDAR_374251 [Caerostris darwini]|uniref:RIIa domain-containing protein n=1 Tax=Caerostris darwini TaxID=1538125 RepID=A0AAV4PG28_9ARAC|nr:hypothetical protein CDAR_374251 [Caerostris darwini]
MADRKEDLRPDDHDRLRKEFREVIVPLLRNSVIDKPSDVTEYCARYFQCRLDERSRNQVPDSREQKSPKETPSKSSSRTRNLEPKPQLQGSTSQPVLTEDGRSNRLSLRETSSWSNPSDSSSMPRRLWEISYDLADAMSRIGDQLNENTTCEGIEEKARPVPPGGHSKKMIGVASSNPNNNTRLTRKFHPAHMSLERPGTVLPQWDQTKRKFI